MKVNVYETVEVSDQQRIMIAQVLDEELTKRKASRAEMKTFVWDQGSEWASSLTHIWAERFGPGGAPTAATDEDDQLAAEGKDTQEDLMDLLGDSEDDDTDDELADLL